LAGSGCLPWL